MKLLIIFLYTINQINQKEIKMQTEEEIKMQTEQEIKMQTEEAAEKQRQLIEKQILEKKMTEVVEKLCLTEIIRSGNVEHLKRKIKMQDAPLNLSNYLPLAISARQPEIFMFLFDEALAAFKYNHHQRELE